MDYMKWRARRLYCIHSFWKRQLSSCLLPQNFTVKYQSFVLTSPQTTERSTRKFHRPYLAVEEVFSTRLPSFVRDKLKALQFEIMETLVRNAENSPSLLSTCFSSSAFTKTFQEMAKYYFDQGGKLFRPTICLLMARACNQFEPKSMLVDSGRETVTRNQYKIAVISEMIHTASLVHDDVIDKADIRRGSRTVNALWGNKMAVLVGDFILARATQVLCSIGRPSVISVMATIIEDLVKGEFMQMNDGADLNASQRFNKYMAKTYSKTASLFANSCKSAAMLSDVSEADELSAYEYGKSLGIAFQMIDDLLDYVSTSSVTGKPTANDLKLGFATAPVLFAAEEYPELNKLIKRSFSKEGDVELAWEIVGNSAGLEKTRIAAREHAEHAVKMVRNFPNGDGVRDHLIQIALAQTERNRKSFDY
ncbi:Polyprenyl synthetase family protein [Acanthocheilonema viteae]